jgi:nucleoid-associated protein YgaU
MPVAPVLSRAAVLSPEAGSPGLGRAARGAVVIPFPEVRPATPAGAHPAGVSVARQRRVVRAARVGLPPDRPVAKPAGPGLRLTRRGRRVLAVAVLGLGLLAGWLGARVVHVQSTVPAGAPAVVEVRSGDTLWSIARRVAPQADPRAVIDQLQRRNDLTGGMVRPGQRLVVRP